MGAHGVEDKEGLWLAKESTGSLVIACGQPQDHVIVFHPPLFILLNNDTTWQLGFDSCLPLKVALGVSPQFFSIWIRVLNHNKHVEIKQFSKEDIKQNNISTVILLIKFLVYQWDLRHLQGSRIVYIFIYTLYSCSIVMINYNQFFMHINHKDTC